MARREKAGQRITGQIRGIALVPGITFLVLFAVLGAVAFTHAASLHLDSREGREGAFLARVLTALQTERRLSVEHVADPGPARLDALRAQTEATDTAVDDLNSAGERVHLTRGGGSPSARAHTDTAFHTALDDLTGVRSATVAGDRSEADTRAAYGAAIDRGIAAYDALARTFDHGPAAAAGSDSVALMRAQDLFSQADARISGALAGGGTEPADRHEADDLVDAARTRLDEVDPALTGRAATVAGGLDGSAEWRRVQAGDTGDWRSDADAVSARLAELTAARTGDATALARDAAFAVSALALGGTALSLLAGGAAYAVASRSGRRLVSRLARLRAETLDLARTELPAVMARLERGEPIDADTAVRPLDYGDDEVGQVADAFTTAQRTAVRAAVRQADLRAGVNRVFLGIAHRNQSLVQRQLKLLDRIERDEDDPDLLAELFRLDHLATRGRRNAENLVILGGSQPGRRWRDPIPLLDVLRGAISETEEYTRIELRTVPALALSGAVVADVIHLVAELVENATAFSPPHTTVDIHSEVVPKGVVVEIEDRGLGMSEDALVKANATLSEAPEFDVMAINQDLRLGLFVVARLAAKHGVHVQLCPSPHGGTRAVVLVPGPLISRRGAPPARRAGRPRPAAPGTIGPTGPVPAAAEPEPVPAGGGRAPLPKRRKQVGLDPRLRARPAPDHTPEPATPEKSRMIMSAFQEGTRRGRCDDSGAAPGAQAPAGDHMGESSE